jgi:hypothetical protein
MVDPPGSGQHHSCYLHGFPCGYPVRESHGIPPSGDGRIGFLYHAPDGLMADTEAGSQ